MTKFAWGSYMKYAWGFNELAPLSRAVNNEALFGHDLHSGLTIIDSLDTLYIMGLTEEYELGKSWIIENIINRPDFHLVRRKNSSRPVG